MTIIRKNGIKHFLWIPTILIIISFALFACTPISNSEPLASISTQSQKAMVGNLVLLSGESSANPDGGKLIYKWNIESFPADSAVILEDSSDAKSSFIPDKPGTYNIGLVVTNEQGISSHPASTEITIIVKSDDWDGDDIDNALDKQQILTPDANFSDPEGVISGTILDRGDQIISIIDLPAPEGISIKAAPDGGINPAKIAFSKGQATLVITPGDQVIINSGSLIFEVISGPVEILITGEDGNNVQLSISEGCSVIFDAETFSLTAPGSNNSDITLIVGTEVICIPPGSVYTLGGTIADIKDVIQVYTGTVDYYHTTNPEPLNSPPVVADQVFSIDENSAAGTLVGVIIATDPNTNDQLLYELSGIAAFVIDPDNGEIRIATGATLDYELIEQYIFTVTVSDGHGANDDATVTVNINNCNDPPVAVDDEFQTDAESQLGGVNVMAANPTTSDSDLEGDPMTVDTVEDSPANVGNQITLPSGALLTVNADGTINYDPNSQFEYLASGDNTTDSFTYSLTDGNSSSNIATVTITITGINDAPVAIDDGIQTNEDSQFNGDVKAANPTTPDYDIDGDLSTVDKVNGLETNVGNQITLASGALVTVNADGTFTYDPNGQFEYLSSGDIATDNFSYTITDGTVSSNMATVTINITGVNDVPVAINDIVQTDEDSELNGNVLAANPDIPDSDAEGQALTVYTVNGEQANVGNQIILASGALLTANADGTFNYDPNSQFDYLTPSDNATDNFTYTVSDGTNQSNTATVNITITGVNDPPAVVMDRDIPKSEERFILLTIAGTDVDNDDADLVGYIHVFPMAGTGWLWQYADDFPADPVLLTPANPILTDPQRRCYYEPPADAGGNDFCLFQVKLYDGVNFSEPFELSYDLRPE